MSAGTNMRGYPKKLQGCTHPVLWDKKGPIVTDSIIKKLTVAFGTASKCVENLRALGDSAADDKKRVCMLGPVVDAQFDDQAAMLTDQTPMRFDVPLQGYRALCAVHLLQNRKCLIQEWIKQTGNEKLGLKYAAEIDEFMTSWLADFYVAVQQAPKAPKSPKKKAKAKGKGN